MRLAILLLISIFATEGYTQEKFSDTYEDEFKELVAYFFKVEEERKKASEYGPNVKIPNSLYYKYFDEEPSENIVSINAYRLLAHERYIAVIVSVNRPQGGYTVSRLLCCFTKDGEILGKKWLPGTSISYEGGTETRIRSINDTILQTIKREIHFNEGNSEDSKIHRNRYKYYIITEAGISEKYEDQNDFGRIFPYSSKRIIPIEELKELSLEDLDIMRNEIYAILGYNFKSAKWKEYFGSKNWYRPAQYFENNDLSITERENVQNILDVARVKK